MYLFLSFGSVSKSNGFLFRIQNVDLGQVWKNEQAFLSLGLSFPICDDNFPTGISQGGYKNL